ncbi:acyltransferase [Vibrio kanaloae]|uniref:acyltransferase n=1 Tax=Vibrio kanaloae TaxID=170673 RepID=UPI000988B966|nr:acyltransferase [Vibrio kanaloae]QPK05350.1 acyltransferase [Vibrio kanaloae]
MLKKTIRMYLFRRKNKKNKTVIMNGSFFHHENINFGQHCYVGPGAEWFGLGQIEIGAGTVIGPKSVIWTADHNYNSNYLVPYDKSVIKGKVTIGEGCWLGYGVLITPGVSIGDGVVIAMGSVVTKNVEDYSIVGGNPAKLIGRRKDTNITQTLIESKKFYMKDKNGKV